MGSIYKGAHQNSDTAYISHFQANAPVLHARPLKKKQYPYNMQIIPNFIQSNIQIIIT